LGDTVRFLPILQVIRERYRGRCIIAIARDEAQREILETASVADETAIYDPRRLPWRERIAFLRRLHRARPSLLISTYGNIGWWTRIFSRISRIPVRVGYAPRPFFTHPLPLDPGRSRRDLELDILRALKIPIPSPLPSAGIRVPAAVIRENDELLRVSGIGAENILVGAHIGLNTLSHGKCWPVEHWRDLFRRILRDLPAARFLILGGPDETAVRRALAAFPFPPEAIDLIGRTGYLRTADLIRRCRLFITNDSFLLHLAGAFRAPILALFGPTAEKVAIPADYRATVVVGDCPLRPCYRIGPPGARNFACDDYRCMRDISVERVYAAARDLLGEDRENPKS